MTQRIIKTVSRSCGLRFELEDKGVEFIDDEGRFFIVCEKSVYEIITADMIDPENASPETRHSYKKTCTIGANSQSYRNHFKESLRWLESPLVFYLIKEIDSLKKDITHCFLTLLTAEETCNSINSRIDFAIQEYDKVFELKNDSFMLPQLPMIDHLNQDVSSFFSYCKQFCEECSNFVKKLFTELEIKTKKDIKKEVERSNLLDQTKIKLLDVDELLIVVSNIRNALSYNHQKKGQEVHIFDFSNTKGNKIMPPSICFDLSNYQENPFETNVRYDLMHLMSDIIENLSEVFPKLLNARFDEFYSRQPDKIPKWFFVHEEC